MGHGPSAERRSLTGVMGVTLKKPFSASFWRVRAAPVARVSRLLRLRVSRICRGASAFHLTPSKRKERSSWSSIEPMYS